MHSFVTHKIIVISIVLFLFSFSNIYAESVDTDMAAKATGTFLRSRNIHTQQQFQLFSEPKSGMTDTRRLSDDDGTALAYVIRLQPQGFVVTSADTNLTPIIAYSFMSSFPVDDNPENPLNYLLKEDMKRRMKALAESKPSETVQNQNRWNLYTEQGDEPTEDVTFQQWPPDNTSSTGGWLNTAWHQGTPYNDLCPLDPVDANRSVVGCVATAMAQILNFHHQSDVRFDEHDSYTLLSGLSIDSDSEVYDFPSFEQLNEHLNSLRLKYSRREDPNDMDSAALSFACGIASAMDYSSEGSGAYILDAQLALRNKFRLYSADLTGGLTSESHILLQENIINRFPVLLGIALPDGHNGHAIVCDGFNTNGEYHLNFGWGTPYPEDITEVWYRLPSDLPNYTSIIDEMILNIQPFPSSIELDQAPGIFYSTPDYQTSPRLFFIKNNSMQPVLISSISSPEGFLISQTGDEYTTTIENLTIERPGQEHAIYIKFSPEENQSYYGTLSFNYGDNYTKNVLLKGYSFVEGTQIQQGEVSGFWMVDQSPYLICGDIEVKQDDLLFIEPGVKVIFTGPHSLTIGHNATLMAEGMKNRMIEFTAFNKDIGWTGLRFIDSGYDDTLSYCIITGSKKNVESTSYYSARYNDENGFGGAVYCSNSHPVITNCKITNNSADTAGAIFCYGSAPVISNTLIANNFATGGMPQTGGIYTNSLTSPIIKNCTIVNNSPGGMYAYGSADFEVTNCILWGNERYQIESDPSRVSFCDIQDGFPGQGNIDNDPCFFAPSSGAGIDYDGLAANWTLQSCSPCINSGTETDLPPLDLAGARRTYSNVIDMGAYENQSNLPLITVNPNLEFDAGIINIDSNSIVEFDITNTGKMDFDIEYLSISEPNSVFSIITPIENHTLSPEDSVHIEILFSPNRQRRYNGTLNIFSTSSNFPHKKIKLKGVGVTGTIIPEGPVEGTWTCDNNPYTVTGDIAIPQNRTLTINPGVEVIFAGYFKMTVGYMASLRAVGTESDHIVFTSIDKEEGWGGIRLINTQEDDILQHCTIEYANKLDSNLDSIADTEGGGIICCGSYRDEPYFPITSSPIIDHCLLSNNSAIYGGAIACLDDSEAVITNNTLIDNEAMAGGAIEIYFAYGTIKNNIIADNYAIVIGGGIVNLAGNPTIQNNTIAFNRPNSMHLDLTYNGLMGLAAAADITNNIIWHNDIYIYYDVEPGEYNIQYNNIQGGWDGQGNICLDPLFANTESRDFHLKSQAGRWDPVNQTWVRDIVTSPCIDAGDPNSPTDDELEPNGGRINMGAYGGTAQASKSYSSEP